MAKKDHDDILDPLQEDGENDETTEIVDEEPTVLGDEDEDKDGSEAEEEEVTERRPSSFGNEDTEEKNIWPILLGAVGIGLMLGLTLGVVIGHTGRKTKIIQVGSDGQTLQGGTQETKALKEAILKGDPKKTEQELTRLSNEIERARKNNTDVILDKGMESQTETTARNKIAVEKVTGAQQSVTWVTNYPTAPKTLDALREKKRKDGIPILIIMGKNAQVENAAAALSYGFSVLQSNYSLEEPQSLLVIDNKELIDISRSRLVWLTKDQKVLKETIAWLGNITENALPLEIKR